MRSSNISNLFKVACVALLLSACSSTPVVPDGGNAPTCDLEFTGNIYGASAVPTCSSASQDADAGGDWILKIDTSTPDMARVVATLDIGSAPAAGQLTSETVTNWDVTALAASTSCAFQAGSAEVPDGSFTLTLTSFDQPSATAHGTLNIVAYLHAPPTTSCGYGDTENIAITF